MDRRIRHVVFDLGGVLFHWNPQEILRLLKVEDPHFPDHIAEITMTKAWLDFDAGRLKLNESIDQLTVLHKREHLERFIKLSIDKLAPIQHGLHLLEKVKKQGLKTYILSNISSEFIHILTPRYPFLHTFDGAVFSYEVQAIKPQEKIYKALLDKYDLIPQECLFIDDYLINLETAARLGIDTILCKDHEFVEKELKKRHLIE
ncbi:MAG: hypothetical protein BGO14_00410 [Chlamydiales bacterium 38-26]|nr:HAD family phosphatase [Chlamydiales bacterium]OJV07188.1 MAG: hypothetical protein BGO14_00410 [Chlamydiales bacterium 38-26]